jgi:hypothetical protein
VDKGSGERDLKRLGISKVGGKHPSSGWYSDSRDQ